MLTLRPFQKRFLKAVDNPKFDVVALSGPRGLSKTFLLGRILSRCMTPGDPLHQPGKEYVLGAASLEQARLTFAFVRGELEGTGEYRWIDSITRLGCTHKSTNTKLRAISSNPKTSLGLVGVPLLCLDEPGALENVGGERLSDSLFTAMGKVGSSLKLVLAGTLAPQATSEGHWWFDLVNAGTTGSVFVQLFQGNADRWDEWGEIRKCNPLVNISPTFRAKLLEERDAARRDSRLKGRFLSYRLNIPSRDESVTLLTVDDWNQVLARPVPPRQGQPIVAYDLGAGRAWSAAVALYRNGRAEALALAPGIPSIEDQEKRDRVPRNAYRRLVEGGRLRIDAGLRVQRPAHLHRAAVEAWGTAAAIYTDRFRLSELRDVVGGANLIPRIARWSDATEDIRALRRIAGDGPLSVDQPSRDLLGVSLAQALVRSDDQGSVRLQKKSHDNTGRDDVAHALTLAAGGFIRSSSRRPVGLRYEVA